MVQLHGVDAAAAKLIILGVGSENGGQKNAGTCALGVKIHCLNYPCYDLSLYQLKRFGGNITVISACYDKNSNHGDRTRPAVSLLILDDNAGSLELLSSALAQPELEILTASDPEEGLDLVFDRHPQIVLTDLVMPRLSGLDVLERIMEFDPSIDVILMTAHYSTESAVEAIQKGACDYLNKPVSIAALRERVGKLIENARKRLRALQLEDELLENAEFEGIVGNSPLMWDVFSRVRRVAPHYRAVLVTGET